MADDTEVSADGVIYSRRTAQSMTAVELEAERQRQRFEGQCRNHIETQQRCAACRALEGEVNGYGRPVMNEFGCPRCNGGWRTETRGKQKQHQALVYRSGESTSCVTFRRYQPCTSGHRGEQGLHHCMPLRVDW